jgi:hypothetical protein
MAGLLMIAVQAMESRTQELKQRGQESWALEEAAKDLKER